MIFRYFFSGNNYSSHSVTPYHSLLSTIPSLLRLSHEFPVTHFTEYEIQNEVSFGFVYSHLQLLTPLLKHLVTDPTILSQFKQYFLLYSQKLLTRNLLILAELPFFLIQLTQLIFEADSAKLGLIGKFASERRAIFD